MMSWGLLKIFLNSVVVLYALLVLEGVLEWQGCKIVFCGFREVCHGETLLVSTQEPLSGGP